MDLVDNAIYDQYCMLRKPLKCTPLLSIGYFSKLFGKSLKPELPQLNLACIAVLVYSFLKQQHNLCIWS